MTLEARVTLVTSIQANSPILTSARLKPGNPRLIFLALQKAISTNLSNIKPDQFFCASLTVAWRAYLVRYLRCREGGQLEGWLNLKSQLNQKNQLKQRNRWTLMEIMNLRRWKR
ncbi:hypothetical protein Syun_028319 [Stephania yunnanensis]|uniref:Uncharacterized protein n=1 Tax=Stephania yunnanensis TaxID=152371 RepID=A0AAP0EMR9_9MAGN